MAIARKATTDTLTAFERRELAAGAARIGATLPEGFEKRLSVYLELLALWGRNLRLTGALERLTLLRKHVVDSLALAPHLPPMGPILDLGSGAGFPGLVIACLRPDLDVVLVEARRRKASFLAEVARRASLARVVVLNERAEAIAVAWSYRARLVTARAVRLETVLELAAPLLGEGGRIVAMQTPRRTAVAEGLGPRFGLRLIDTSRYVLPDGEQRALFVYGHVSRETSVC